MQAGSPQPSTGWLVGRRTCERPRRNPRYQVESLESRLLLSTVTYANTSSGLWSDGTNWSTGAVPQPGDDVVINQPGNVQVTLPASVSVNSVSITGDTLIVQSGTSLSTTADFNNAGTISVAPDGQVMIGGNYIESAGASLLMPGGGTTTVPTADLLANSDFESPAVAANGTTPPDEWVVSGSATLSNLYAYTGAQSLQMNGPDSSVYESLPVTPGTSYTLSVYAMTPTADRLTGSEAGFYQIEFFDGDGNPIDPTAAPVYVISQGSNPGGPLAGSAGGGGWNAFNTAAVAPPNAATAEAILLTNDTNGIGAGGGSTYWDDPQFGPSVPAPSNFSAVAISNGGVIAVGPTNTVNASGTFTQTATGTLDIQLGGAPATGDFGSVGSTAAASLSGTLESDIVYGYTPSTNDIFTPIEFPTETGGFTAAQLPGGSGYQFQSAITFTNVTLAAVPTTPLVTTVNAAAVIQPVSANLLGANLNWYDLALTTPQTQQLAKAGGLDAFTFPGGGATDRFHFNTVANVDRSWVTPIPQFAQFVQAVGATGLVTLDYGSASPQEAAAELAYLEGSPNDTTQLGVGIEWNDAAGQWQNVNWGTVGYWAAMRGASHLTTDDGLNFLRIKHAAPFANFSFWEIGNEEYGNWEVDHHGTPGPGGVSTGEQHDPATYAAFAAQFAGYAAEILSAAGLPMVSIGIDSGDPGGRSDDYWTQNVLNDGLSLGFVPGFISDHDYVQSAGQENDETLLTNTVSDPTTRYDWTTRYSTYEALLQQTLGAKAAGVQVIATEFNSAVGNNGKQSTSLVDGLFLADSIGSMLDSGYSGGYVWDLRDGWVTSNNNDSNGLYGWREGGDLGLIGDSNINDPPSTGPYVPYPGYFAEQLASKIVQTGGAVVSASSNYQQFDAYSVMEPNGHLDLLVINANSAASLAEQFDIQGFQPSGQAQFWQYGKTQDTAQSQSATGASALANFSATLALTGANFSFTFPAYSMTVIDLAPETPPKIVTPAAAGPNPITGKTTVLNALGSENGNDSVLTYTWSAIGIPSGLAAPTFLNGVNGTNAAKTITASFFGAGSYTFQVTITDANQASITSMVSVVVKQTLTSLIVAPTGVTLPIDTTQQFAAQAFDQFGAVMSAPVTWSRSGGSVGSIGAGGLFSSGASAGNATIRAASGAITASAIVSVIAASISGTVFNDTNADGWKSSAEKGIAGRIVYLEIAGQGTKGERSTATNSTGVFSFANLIAGNYVLIVPTPSGWRSTNPLAAGDPLTVAAGQKISNWSFGQTTLAIVGGNLYLDSNADGKKQSAEPNLAGWTVQLLSTSNSSLKFTVTSNSGGMYSFGAVPAGSYVLSVLPKTNYRPTAPASGSYRLKFSSGQSLTGENFGEHPSAV